MCFHRNSPTCSGSHAGVISCATAFGKVKKTTTTTTTTITKYYVKVMQWCEKLFLDSDNCSVALDANTIHATKKTARPTIKTSIFVICTKTWALLLEQISPPRMYYLQDFYFENINYCILLKNCWKLRWLISWAKVLKVIFCRNNFRVLFFHFSSFCFVANF